MVTLLYFRLYEASYFFVAVKFVFVISLHATIVAFLNKHKHQLFKMAWMKGTLFLYYRKLTKRQKKQMKTAEKESQCYTSNNFLS